MSRRAAKDAVIADAIAAEGVVSLPWPTGWGRAEKGDALVLAHLRSHGWRMPATVVHARRGIVWVRPVGVINSPANWRIVERRK